MNFKPGVLFRFTDGLLLLLAGTVCLALAAHSTAIALASALIFCHFFLFSNIFRLSRSWEFAWTGGFVLLSALTIASQTAGWPLTAVISGLICGCGVSIAMQKPSYHGIFWRQVNPDLQTWWRDALLRARRHYSPAAHAQ